MKPDINTVGGLMPARGYDGQSSRITEEIIDSRVNSGVSVIAPGQVAGLDPANPKCCRLPVAGDLLLGIVHRDPITYHADSSGNVGFAQYQSVPFVRLGFVNATPIEEVTAGDGVVAIFDGSSKAYLGLGTIRGGVSATRVFMRGNRWETSTAANASEPGEVSVLGTGGVDYVTY